MVEDLLAGMLVQYRIGDITRNRKTKLKYDEQNEIKLGSQSHRYPSAAKPFL